ncbi:MAG: phosphodiester glycosidase family protein [Clostridia bacterium]
MVDGDSPTNSNRSKKRWNCIIFSSRWKDCETRPGATMNDLIEIIRRYGAYNATNLDGGTSSAMVVDGKIINDPIDQYRIT